MIQKNLILIIPIFVLLILANLGFAAWREGRNLDANDSWNTAVLPTPIPAKQTPTPGWWGTPQIFPTLPGIGAIK